METTASSSSSEPLTPDPSALEASAGEQELGSRDGELELRARRDAELNERARTAPPAPASAVLAAELDQVAATLAELEAKAGPPAEEQVAELMGRLEAIGEADAGELAEAIVAAAERVIALAERPEPKTPEELALDEQAEALEKARGNYEKRVRAILGPDVPLETCEACEGRGLTLAGLNSGPELKTHAMFSRCEACDGLGSVLTGSLVAGQEVTACPECFGEGFRKASPAAPPAPPALAPEHALAGGSPEPWMGNPAIGAAA